MNTGGMHSCGLHLFRKLSSPFSGLESLGSNEKWIGVDFDGTLAEYHGYHNILEPGKPIPDMVKRVQEWIKAGTKVKIMTARVCSLQPKSKIEEQRKIITAWCEKYLEITLECTSEKDFNMIELWDNRAVGVIENTGIPLRNP